MNTEFQQYRFARIEGHNITRARLEAHFKSGITDLDELEKAIAQQLAAASTTCAPWRKSEIEKTGCRRECGWRLWSFSGRTAKRYDVQIRAIPLSGIRRQMHRPAADRLRLPDDRRHQPETRRRKLSYGTRARRTEARQRQHDSMRSAFFDCQM